MARHVSRAASTAPPAPKDDNALTAKEGPTSEEARATGDFISDYATYADVFEMPRKAHESVAMQLIASELNGRVYIPWGAVTHPLDLWILLLSQSGQGRNTATNLARGVLEQAKITELIQNASWGSGPAFYQRLAEYPVGLYMWPELSVVLRTLKDPRFSGVKEWLTDRYDSLTIPPAIMYRHTGKTQDTPPITFNQAPRINVVATSSWDWFVNSLEQEDTTGGFVPRWVIVSLGDSGRVLPRPLSTNPKLVAPLAEKLRAIHELKGEADLSAVEGIYDNWYRRAHKRFEIQPNPALAMPFFNRLRIHVVKFAVIFEVSQSQLLKVSERAMQRAIETADAIEQTIFEFLPTGMNREGAEVEKMARVIWKAGPVGMLQSKLTLAFKHWKARERKDRLDTLVESGTVVPFVRKPTRGRTAKVYVHNDHLTQHETRFPNEERRQ